MKRFAVDRHYPIMRIFISSTTRDRDRSLAQRIADGADAHHWRRAARIGIQRSVGKSRVHGSPMYPAYVGRAQGAIGVVGFLRSGLVWSVPLLLCISACGPETTSAPLEPASPPAAVPAPSTTSVAPESPPPVVAEEPHAEEPQPSPEPAPEPTVPGSHSTPDRATPGRAKPVKSFAVYSLSRGTGVPPKAREALEQVTNFVEADRKRGVRVTVETTRVGIEGEKRVCVDYEDPRDGARAWERASAIVKGVDLVNLVAEPCASPAAETQKEEEHP